MQSSLLERCDRNTIRIVTNRGDEKMSMQTYMLMMFVTLEQEETIRSIYQQKGWTYTGEGYISKKDLDAVSEKISTEKAKRCSGTNNKSELHKSSDVSLPSDLNSKGLDVEDLSGLSEGKANSESITQSPDIDLNLDVTSLSEEEVEDEIEDTTSSEGQSQEENQSEVSHLPYQFSFSDVQQSDHNQSLRTVGLGSTSGVKLESFSVKVPFKRKPDEDVKLRHTEIKSRRKGVVPQKLVNNTSIPGVFASDALPTSVHHRPDSITAAGSSFPGPLVAGTSTSVPQKLVTKSVPSPTEESIFGCNSSVVSGSNCGSMYISAADGGESVIIKEEPMFNEDTEENYTYTDSSQGVEDLVASSTSHRQQLHNVGLAQGHGMLETTGSKSMFEEDPAQFSHTSEETLQKITERISEMESQSFSLDLIKSEPAEDVHDVEQLNFTENFPEKQIHHSNKKVPKHSRVSNIQMLYCHYKGCNQMFLSCHSLKTHESYHEKRTDSAPVQNNFLLNSVENQDGSLCNICFKHFKQKSSMIRHRKEAHPTPGQLFIFICPVCKRGFRSKRCLKQHSASHGARNFPCTICGKSFYRRSDLQRHLERHAAPIINSTLFNF